ncbi:MAG TPA: AAA family ATPase [Gemmatimonadaceae bacterium]
MQRVFVHALRSARGRGDWLALEHLAMSCLRLDPLNEEATIARAEATVMRGSKAQALALLDDYMEALGEKSLAIGLPAKILRSRIADRLIHTRYAALSERHFVGREEEIALMTNALEEARQGRGGAFLFVGVAGIGKTRLLDEVTRIAELKGIAIVGGRCQPTDVDRPVTVLASLVPALRALPGSLGVSVHSLSLLQRLTEYSEPAESPAEVAETGADGAAIRRAVFDLFDAVADENTVLVTVEDAHWADRFSWKMLRMLAEWSSRHRVLIVVTSRPGADPSQHDSVLDPVESFHVRPLMPLSYTAGESLVTMLMQDQGAEASAEMLRWCVTVSEGNPYYLRELLTRWLETGEPFGVPQSLAELIDRKLDKLSTDALRLMQVCVSFGKWCTLGRLERSEAADPPQLLRALDELTHAGLVTSDGIRVLPKHDLLSQAAQKRLPEPVKMLIHRRIAGVLESEGKDEPVPALLWECAHHWEVAGETGRAVDFLDECGRHLIGVGLPEEAAELYRRALGIQRVEYLQQMTLHEGLLAALRLSGLWEQVLAEIHMMHAVAETANQQLPSHSSLELTEVEARWRTGGMDDDVARQLHGCVDAVDAPAEHRLNAAFWLLALAQSTGQTNLAQNVWETVRVLVETPNVDAFARHQVAMVYHTDYGDLDQAARSARSLVDHARQCKDAIGLVRALRNGSLAMRRAGFWDECEMYLNEAFELASQHHAALGAVDAAHQLAALHLECGRLKPARNWAEVAGERLSSCESTLQETDLLILQTRLALVDGDIYTARRMFRQLPSWEHDLDVRRSQVVASIQLMLTHAEGSPVDASILRAVERMHGMLADRGHQDFPVEALVLTYATLQETSKAEMHLRNYLTVSRRDRGPLPPQLCALADGLNVTLPAELTKLRLCGQLG